MKEATQVPVPSLAQSYARPAQATPKPYFYICLILPPMPSPLALHSLAVRFYTCPYGTLHVT